MGSGRQVKAKGGLKQPLNSKSNAVPSLFDIYRLIESTWWTKTVVRSSLEPHAVLLMPLKAEKYILVVQ